MHGFQSQAGTTLTKTILIAAAAVFAAAAAPAAAQMPKGDAAAGAKVFNQCRACHVTTKGVNRVGPSLHAVVGRKSGTVEKFKYSKANLESKVTWDEATLFKYLEAPMKFMPGTKMAFAGLKKPEDRANVIAYLKTQNK
jgi:cytochrome c